jgi:hypothetical protein
MRRKYSETLAMVTVLVLLLLSHAWAQDPQLLLAQRFKDKVFLIKGWYEDQKLTYDASGIVVGNPRSSSWETSGVQIHSIKLRKDAVVMKGPRVAYVYDLKSHKFSPARVDSSVSITIQRDPRTITPADLDALENAIFIESLKTGDVPDYWREFLIHGEKPDPGGKKHAKPLSETFEGKLSDGQPVYRVDPDRG